MEILSFDLENDKYSIFLKNPINHDVIRFIIDRTTFLNINKILAHPPFDLGENIAQAQYLISSISGSNEEDCQIQVGIKLNKKTSTVSVSISKDFASHILWLNENWKDPVLMEPYLA